jgi:DNA-binding transcriptional LysR family regulator
MNITLRQLEALVAIADTGSFTIAAERLGISQPAVSEAVRRLEAELGFEVFIRTTRAFRLSREGQEVIASAREVLRTMQYTYDSISAGHGGDTRRITIAALPSMIVSVLSPTIRRFRQLHPSVTIEVLDGNQKRATGLVVDGVADLAFVSQGPIAPMLQFDVLTADRFYLVCSNQHPFAGQAEVEWASLTDERFVALESTSSVRKATDNAFAQAGAECVPHYELAQVPSVAALVAAGLGVTALPEFSLTMFREDGLAFVALKNPVFERKIGVVTRKNKPLSAAVSAFVEVCRQFVAEGRGPQRLDADTRSHSITKRNQVA